MVISSIPPYESTFVTLLPTGGPTNLCIVLCSHIWDTSLTLPDTEDPSPQVYIMHVSKCILLGPEASCCGNASNCVSGRDLVLRQGRSPHEDYHPFGSQGQQSCCLLAAPLSRLQPTVPLRCNSFALLAWSFFLMILSNILLAVLPVSLLQSVPFR